MAILITQQMRDDKTRQTYEDLRSRLRRRIVSRSATYIPKFDLEPSQLVSDELIEEFAKLMARELVRIRIQTFHDMRKKNLTVDQINELQEKSRKRALALRKRIGLTDDPMKIDGFNEIKGILKPYSRVNEDSVDVLDEAREEEKD
jgi:hypothetical protein